MNNNFDIKIYDEKHTSKNFDKYQSHIDLEINSDRHVDIIRNRIVTDDLKRKELHPGKDYRRTEEQVFDNRTKQVINKLIKNDILKEINGCISTGKEGNVFIGIKGEKAPMDWPNKFAVKIYKTCILKFKDRDKYINGEMRFQHKVGSRNSRKNVILWAQKEFRNLKRLYNNKIPSPRPLFVESNVVFMELITNNDEPAPLLKKAEHLLQPEDYEKLYLQIMYNIREMYQKSKLVHSDLSEYNILVRDKKAIIIDVGQAVEHDNANSSYFLRQDIANVTAFFQKVGVKTTPLQRSLEFVVEKELVFKEDVVLNEIRKMEEETSDDIFRKVYIPQRLDQVADPDLEVMEIEYGDYSNAELHGAYTGVITSELAPYEGELLDDIYFMEEEEEEYEDEDEPGFYNMDVRKIIQPVDDGRKLSNKKSFNDNENTEIFQQRKYIDENNENNDEEEGNNEEENNCDEKSILKQSFDRKNFSSEEWKKIQMKLKIARREKRKTKTPKIVKRKNYRKSHPNAK